MFCFHKLWNAHGECVKGDVKNLKCLSKAGYQSDAYWSPKLAIWLAGAIGMASVWKPSKVHYDAMDCILDKKEK